MTQYWTSNACAMSRNTAFGNFNLEGFRKGLVVQIFLVFFMYFITQVLHAFRYKNTSQKSHQVRQSIRQSTQGNQANQSGNQKEQKVDPRPDLPWHEKKWNRTFAIIFSTHCVSMGTCLLFSPFAGAMTIAYLHFGIFVAFVVCQFKQMEGPSRFCRILMDLMNLTLILIGVIGINNNTCNKKNYCSVTQSNLGATACFS